jgi:hypothetical protein
MFPILGKQGRGLLLMIAAATLATAACSSSTGTASPAPSATGVATGPATTSQASSSGGGSVPGGAAANLANLTSYKFKMTVAGGDFGQMLSLLGVADATGAAPVNVTGTVVTKPAKAADIHIASIHIVEIDGYDYMDMGLGGFVKTQMTDKGWADTISPATMFTSSIDASSSGNFLKVGSENKNGVDADHYQASSGAFDEQASILGITGATWSGDVWIAKDGGYPVSTAVIAKATDNSVVYEMTFDLSNVNDSANSVVAPTNVVGA